MKRHFFALAIALSFSGASLARDYYQPPVRTKITLKNALEREAKNRVRAVRGNSIKMLNARSVHVGVVQVGEPEQYDIIFPAIGGTLQPKMGTCSMVAVHSTLISDGCSGADMTTSSCAYRIQVDAIGSQSGTLANVTCPVLVKWQPTDPAWSYGWDAQSEIDWTEYLPMVPPKCEACEKGSDIGVDGQTISESIPIVGTDFEMVYSSRFAYQYKAQGRLVRYPEFRPNGLTVSVHHAYNPVKKLLYTGTGSVQSADYDIVSGNYRVVSPSGDEVFFFSSTGVHLNTKYGLTGSTKYTFAYETADDQLKSITDAFGNVTRFWKDTYGNLSSIQAPHGQTSTVNLDPTTLMITAITNPASQTYSLAYYTDKDLLYTFTKPGGQYTTFTYNEFGRMTIDLGFGGNSWTFSSNPLATPLQIQKVSAMGRTTTYGNEYVGTTYTRVQTDPSGHETITEEAPNGALDVDYGYMETLDSRANDNRLGANVQRRTSSSVIMGTNQSTTTYSQSLTGFTNLFNFTSLTKQATTSGRTSTETYTSATNTFLTTSHEGATTTKVINSYEQPTSYQLGSDTPWTYTYDSLGRLSVLDQGGYNTLTYTYNSNGYVQKVKNARNEETLYTYGNAGRLLTTTLPDLRVITYTYDSNGNLLTVTPPSKPAHTFTINSKELMASYTPPALTGVTPIATTYNYNNDKELTSVVRPDGTTLNFNYGSTTGLLDSITWGSVGTYYTYFANSPLIDHIDSRDGITSKYTYYGDKLKTEEQSNTSSTFLYSKVTYNYDVDHRQTSRVFRGNAATPATTISTTYNNDSKPILIGNLALTYIYPSGRVSTTTLDNISDVRTYDSLGKLQSYTATYAPTSTVLYSYTLTRDIAGRISGKSETVQGVTDTYVYTYDVAGRLTAITKNGSAYSSYVYDTNGNRTSGVHAGTSFTSTFNDQDWMLTYNSTTFSYNNNGDLTTIQYSPTVSKALVYDPFGNLKSVTTQPGSVLYNYNLDGNHRRVARVISGSASERYLYEGQYRIIGQVGGAGVIQKQYVYGTNINSPDYMINSSNVRFRFIKDHLGSPRLVVKSTDGTILQRMDYTDLGKVVTNTNAAAHPFGFAGGIYDSNTGFTHFGARDYDAETGRWLVKDPIRFGGGDENLYGYVLADPVNNIDPNGKLCIAAVGLHDFLMQIAGNTLILIWESELADLQESLKSATCPEDRERILAKIKKINARLDNADEYLKKHDSLNDYVNDAMGFCYGM